MALQINKITEHGITLPSAYARVVNFSGDVNNMSITVVTHADAAARTNGDTEVTVDYITIVAPDTVPAGGLIQWCYNQIKVLPEFSGYLDV